uniref:Uncharacterized protein n=1 Tax=Oryza sativa subsp. japonica TaxID=39947 RepID=Q6I5C4_ORYSJ|nr:hypothetical protein [Oryza sativa Japonica Group]
MPVDVLYRSENRRRRSERQRRSGGGSNGSGGSGGGAAASNNGSSGASGERQRRWSDGSGERQRRCGGSSMRSGGEQQREWRAAAASSSSSGGDGAGVEAAGRESLKMREEGERLQVYQASFIRGLSMGWPLEKFRNFDGNYRTNNIIDQTVRKTSIPFPLLFLKDITVSFSITVDYRYRLKRSVQTGNGS